MLYESKNSVHHLGKVASSVLLPPSNLKCEEQLFKYENSDTYRALFGERLKIAHQIIHPQKH